MKEPAAVIFRVKFSSTLKIEAESFSETFIDISTWHHSQETLLFIPQTSQASNSSVNTSLRKIKLPEMYYFYEMS
jgi:hypothetical protein